MSPWKVIITSAFFTLFASFNQQAATAGEKGTMDFVQSILIANQMAIEQGDHKMVAIVGNGTITFSNSDGGPFTELTERPADPRAVSLKAQLDDLLLCIDGKPNRLATPAEALRVQKLVETMLSA